MSFEASLPLSGEVLLPQRSDVAGSEPLLRKMTAAIRRGEKEAFTRFYHLYSLRLYKYLLVLAKGDEAEAREVLQTVVVKMAKNMELFDNEGRLWSWLSRLARNAFVDRCRARRRDRRFVALEDLPLELEEVAAVEDRLSHCVARVLEGFAAEESELLRAAYIDERPLQDLADEAGQSYKALESRLGRLRRKLKESLLKGLRDEKEL